MVHYQRWVNISYLVICALLWAVVRHLAELGWDLARLTVSPDAWVSPPDLIALAVAVLTFVILLKNSTVNVFMNEVAQELAKVTWADNKQTIMSAGVIAVLIAICSLILVGYDSLWQAVMGLLVF